MAGWFDLNRSSDSKYYFTLRAENEQVLITSETHEAKPSAQNGITSVRTNSQLDSNFKRKLATNGQHYFTLIAANYETLGTSEMYTTEQGMENGIGAVKRVAPTATVRDHT